MEQPPSDSCRRSLFPLPLPPSGLAGAAVKSALSSRSRRRLHRRECESASVRECVAALNWLNDGSWSKEASGKVRQPNLSQRMALDHVRERVSLMGAPPTDLSAEGPLRELCGSPGYEDVDGIPASLAPLDLELLSLPAEGHRPSSLAALWGGSSGSVLVEEFCRKRVLPISQAQEALRENAPKRSYMDPSLRHIAAYHRLVCRLFGCGMVVFVILCVRRWASLL